MVVLGAVGFASASIVNGANASSADTTTGTTASPPGQTVTVTVTTTSTTTRTVVKRPAIVLFCHRTPGGRFVTVRVQLSVGVLAAHLRHGDATGKCTAANVR
jgi:hypothetical protein